MKRRIASPDFYSKAAICKGLSISPEILEDVLKNKASMFSVKPRMIGEKERPIYVASGNLRRFLRRMHLRLRRVEIEREFFGGVRGCSVRGNAEFHAGSKYILNLDLKNFFPSVKTEMVERVFRDELGCTQEMSALLATICTADDQLPQGFATSPLLSIFTLAPLASDLRDLLRRQGLKFTFWIDDLTISGGNNPRPLIPAIERLCKKYGLKLNRRKIHLGIQGRKRQEVTGVTINGRTFSPAPGYAKETLDMLHLAAKNGWEFVNDVYGLEVDTEKQFLEFVNGRVAWIERVRAKSEEKFVKALAALIADYQKRAELDLPMSLLARL